MRGALTVLVVLAGLMTVPSAALASFSWSPAVRVDADAGSGGFQVLSLACPTTHQCTSVDGRGYETTFDPGSPQDATTVFIDPEGLESIACPSQTQCTAIGNYDEVTFNPTSPGTPTPTPIGGTSGFFQVACPTTTQCTTIDNDGQAVTFNPASPSTPNVQSAYDFQSESALTCPSVSQCTASGLSDNQAVTFDPATPSSAYQVLNLNTGVITSFACPSTDQCTAASWLGQEATFNPTSANVPPTVTIDTAQGGPLLEAIACPALSRCVTVDDSGNAVDGDPTSSSAWNTVPIAGASAILAVACPSISECVAVDQNGLESTGTDSDPLPPAAPSNLAPPTISGSVAGGQTLAGGQTVAEGQTETASTGAWTGSPTSYAYQWEDCDPSGTDCAAIAGATSQSYKLSAHDVGYAIVVEVSAINAGGESTPADSEPTGLVQLLTPGKPTIRAVRATSTGLKVTVKCEGARTDQCDLAFTLAAGLAKRAAATLTATLRGGSTRAIKLRMIAPALKLLHRYGELGGELTVSEQLLSSVKSVGRYAVKIGHHGGNQL